MIGSTSRRVVALLAVLLVASAAPAVGVVAAQDGATTPTATPTASPTPTPTPTPTATPASSPNGNGSDGPTAIATPAKLSITQPHYIDTAVKRGEAANGTVYIVNGGSFELLAQNFDDESVIRFGVQPQAGRLDYDQPTGKYIFTPDGNGTYTLYWVVAEEVPVDGSNETTVERKRYQARIQVRQSAFAHVPQAEYDRTQAQAANWSEVVSSFGSLGDPDTPIGQKLENAREAYQFLVDPLAALKGDFTAAAIILLLTNGGRLLLALLLIVPIATVAQQLIRARKRDRRLPDIDALEQEELQVWMEKRKKLLINTTPFDLPIPEARADRLTLIGDNLWEILQTVRAAFSEDRLKRVIAQAMGHKGYALGVPSEAMPQEHDDGSMTVPDAAADLTPGDVQLLPPAEDGDPVADGGVERLAVADAPPVYTDAIAYEDLDRTMLDSSVPLDAIDAPIAPTETDDDLLAELDIGIPDDYRTREQFAEDLAEVWRFALSHPYTDEEGCVRPEQDLLNIIGLLATVSAERYDVPTYRSYRDLFLYLGDALDENQRLADASERTGFTDFDFGGFDGGSDAD